MDDDYSVHDWTEGGAEVGKREWKEAVSERGRGIAELLIKRRDKINKYMHRKSKTVNCVCVRAH